MEKRCLKCNKIFNKPYYSSRKVWELRKFCSQRCSGTFNNTAKQLIGRKRPLEVIEKLRSTMFKKGQSTWNKGLKLSEEQKGINHWNWKGGYERILLRNKNRRARLLGSIGSHSLEEWNHLKEKYDYRCLMCGKQEPEIKLTEDHIIPLSKKGSNNIDNIQPLCKSCNSKKRVQIIDFTLGWDY